MQKRAEGVYMRENGTICPFGVFSPGFMVPPPPPSKNIRSQRSVRRCELATNKDSGNICNAIAGKYSGRINLEQLPERSVIGNL